MNAPLRRRHWHMALALGVVVPALVLWSLLVRPVPATMATIPGTLTGAGAEPRVNGAEPQRLDFTAASVTAEVHAVRDGRRQLVVRATTPLHVPDPLLYWGAPMASDELPERLPDDVRLLGPWDGRPAQFDIPLQAGSVWLYALGHQRVVGTLAIPAEERAQ